MLLWKFPLRDLCFTERREFRLRSVFLQISEKIISVRMNIKTLKIINGAKRLLFQQCRLGIANADDPVLCRMYFRGATCKVETFRFLAEEADLRAEECKSRVADRDISAWRIMWRGRHGF